MAKANYYEVLQEAMNQPPIKDCKLSRTEIEEAISAISAQLIRPLPNEERLCLVAERSELRATLKAMKL